MIYTKGGLTFVVRGFLGGFPLWVYVECVDEPGAGFVAMAPRKL
jgi:hypothetical protein